jgi:hypothetical protein
VVARRAAAPGSNTQLFGEQGQDKPGSSIAGRSGNHEIKAGSVIGTIILPRPSMFCTRLPMENDKQGAGILYAS